MTNILFNYFKISQGLIATLYINVIMLKLKSYLFPLSLYIYTGISKLPISNYFIDFLKKTF